ncbi:hypothetical protein FFF34_011145 [Inquilinus sp. KBS0705]|nr:hypothetical protein FFF34_011145 [Inquilinus sp. KBS0705]
MKIDDSTIQLAAKKLAQEATGSELTRLNQLMVQNTDTGYFLQLLFNSPTDANDDERSARLFRKIKSAITEE